MIGARLMCGAIGAAAIVVSSIAPPVFAEIHGGAPPIPRLVQAGATHAAWIPSGRVLLAQTKKGVDRNVIEEIQRLLGERGLDPGPADGSMGPRTSRAIARYQKSAGLVADGHPTRELLYHLRKPPGDAGASETTEAAPVVGVETSEDPPPPPPPLPPVPSLTNTVWRFIDETGSTFTLTFAPNGVVEGVLYEQFWKWRQSGDNVTISYDNGMGRQVTRSGTLSGLDAMSGSASASRSGEWTWSAERITEAGQ
jgi:peptidoglycan hydrolase-like protein with peptidoglycan-binding domain